GALLLLMYWSSRYAGSDRARMARVFGPALSAIEAGLVLLILLEGASATAGIYLLELGLFDAYHPQIVGGMALASVLAAIGVVPAVVSVRRRTPIDLHG